MSEIWLKRRKSHPNNIAIFFPQADSSLNKEQNIKCPALIDHSLLLHSYPRHSFRPLRYIHLRISTVLAKISEFCILQYVSDNNVTNNPNTLSCFLRNLWEIFNSRKKSHIAILHYLKTILLFFRTISVYCIWTVLASGCQTLSLVFKPQNILKSYVHSHTKTNLIYYWSNLI